MGGLLPGGGGGAEGGCGCSSDGGGGGGGVGPPSNRVACELRLLPPGVLRGELTTEGLSGESMPLMLLPPGDMLPRAGARGDRCEFASAGKYCSCRCG